MRKVVGSTPTVSTFESNEIHPGLYIFFVSNLDHSDYTDLESS